MTTNDDDDFKIGPQGGYYVALWDAAKELGETHIGNPTKPKLQEIKDLALARGLADVSGLALATVSKYLNKAKVLAAAGLLEKFKGSVYDFHQHPEYFVKLCKLQPDLCRILLDRGRDPNEMTHGERRLKYEMLVSLADHEEIKAEAKKIPADNLPPGRVTFFVKTKDGHEAPIRMKKKNFEQWISGPKE